MKKITSAENPKIKLLKKLKISNKRKKQGLVLVEGKREINLAKKGKFELVDYFFSPDFVKERPEGENITELTTNLFKNLSYRQNPDGHMAIFKEKKLKLESISLDKNSIIVVLDGIEKPGNLGAIIRTCEASGVKGIIITNYKIDIFGHNVIRASQGAIFTSPIVVSSVEKAQHYLKINNFETYLTSSKGAKSYLDADIKEKVAFVFGSEDTGVTEKWMQFAQNNIKISMLGKISSLNLSVSVGIIVYEALRKQNNS